jgi:alkanesulfonate monooxygenase SsuD/methylene tetrahydromethanopterin reductase-like flavin-dependent oxidoreductase (luciferase family)
MDRLETGARVIRALDAGRPATLSQPYYPLVEAQTHPTPSHGRLRVVVGGRGERRTLRVVAEFADEWNVTRVDIAGFRAKHAVLGRHCAAVGRDPATIATSLMIPLAIGRDSWDVARRIAAARAIFPALPEDEAAWRAAGFLVGNPEQVISDLRSWAAAGMERALLQMLDQEDVAALEIFARDVLPHV